MQCTPQHCSVSLLAAPSPQFTAAKTPTHPVPASPWDAQMPFAFPPQLVQIQTEFPRATSTQAKSSTSNHSNKWQPSKHKTKTKNASSVHSPQLPRSPFPRSRSKQLTEKPKLSKASLHPKGGTDGPTQACKLHWLFQLLVPRDGDILSPAIPGFSEVNRQITTSWGHVSGPGTADNELHRTQNHRITGVGRDT